MKKPKRYPLIEHDICARLYAGLGINELQGKKKVPVGTKPKRLDALPLIIRQSQWVKFADKFFYLRKEGLYRFWDWGKLKWPTALDRPQILDGNQKYSCVIVFRKDILALLGAIATLQVHGIQHVKLSYEKRIAKLKTGNLSTRCGDTSKFMCELLTKLGFKARLLQSCRGQGRYNSYNCGHILFEFYWPKYHKWVMADVDIKKMFVKNGVYLNAAEIKDILDKGQDFELQPLTVPYISTVDTTKAVAGRFCSDAMANSNFVDTDRLMAWYRIRFAGLGIVDGSAYFYNTDPVVQGRVCRYNPLYFKPMDKNEWLKRFYGK